MQHFSMVARKLLQELNILKVAMQDLTPDSVPNKQYLFDSCLRMFHLRQRHKALEIFELSSLYRTWKFTASGGTLCAA